MTQQQPDSDPGPGAAARDAAIRALAANLAGVAVLIALNVAVARRDQITALVLRARRRLAGTARNEHVEREVARFRRDFSAWDHAGRPA